MDASKFGELTEGEKKGLQKRTVVSKGELLTMDDAEALEYGFSKATAGSLETVFEKLGIAPVSVTRIEQTWSESMVRFIDSILPFLLMIGLGCLYVEIKTPGFGIPGYIGIICLTLVFLNQYLVGMADYIEFLLLLAGAALMFIEMFVLPGFGIAGYTALLLITAGLVLALQGFVIPAPDAPWEAEIFIENIIEVLGSLIFAVIAGLLFLRFVMPKIPQPSDGGAFLKKTLANARVETDNASIVRPGDEGIAKTTLRPSGKAVFSGNVVDVVTYGEFIQKGTPVKVSEVRDNRVIVEKKLH